MKRICLSLFYILLLSTGAGAQDYAVVNLSSAFMRAKPSYTSENLSQARMGVLVEILDTQSYWVKIRTPEPYEGWVNEEMLARKTEAEAEAWLRSERYICTTEFTHVFTEPDKRAGRVCDLSMGNILSKGDRTRGKWVQVALPSGQEGWVLRNEVRDFKQWAETVRPTPESIVSTAKLFIGTPYLWGGFSAKHFDCSGFVGFCWFMNGVILPRDTTPQSELGEEVSPEDMDTGDLVFFGAKSIEHVGIAIDNTHIIHCSQKVKINSLHPGDEDYFQGKILHIRRNPTGCRIADSPVYFAQ